MFKRLLNKVLVMSVASFTFLSSIMGVDAAKITYHANGGRINSGSNPTEYTVNVPEGFAFNIENGASVTGPTGYTFDGWYDRQDWVMGARITNFTFNPGQHLEVWAKYALEYYTISYDLDGGSVNGTNPTTYHYKDNPTAIINPTKDHYEFAGWVGTELTQPTMQLAIRDEWTGNRNYTATWTPKEYSITYDLDGGSINGTNPATYNIETPDFTLNNPTKDGYNFLGWEGTNLTSTTKDVTINNGSTGNRNYKAIWSPINYTIDYDLDGGSVNGTNPATYNIETPDFTLNNPTKDGYNFLGWEGTNLANTTLDVTINKGSTGNRNYKAIWEQIINPTNNNQINYNAIGQTYVENPANKSTSHSSLNPNTIDEITKYILIFVSSLFVLLHMLLYEKKTIKQK